MRGSGVRHVTAWRYAEAWCGVVLLGVDVFGAHICPSLYRAPRYEPHMCRRTLLWGMVWRHSALVGVLQCFLDAKNDF